MIDNVREQGYYVEWFRMGFCKTKTILFAFSLDKYCIQFIALMQIDINVIIEQEIRKLNNLFNKGAKIAGKVHKPFVYEDYTYLKESQTYFGTFALPYYLTYAIFKDVEYRIQNPYPKTIWYWKKAIDNNKAKDFLPIQSKLMYDTLNSYLSLLKSENYLQALILFRSYIEYSSQFYACLLDYEFFQKYTENEMLDEEYKKLWFNSLRPEKVLSKIKGMHAEINRLLKKKEIVYNSNAIYRRWFKPFDSDLRGFLYNSISGLSHGSYPALAQNDESKLYSLVFLCSVYLVESQVVIDEITSVYFRYSPKALFNKWITVEIYLKSREAKASLYVGNKKS